MESKTKNQTHPIEIKRLGMQKDGRYLGYNPNALLYSLVSIPRDRSMRSL